MVPLSFYEIERRWARWELRQQNMEWERTCGAWVMQLMLATLGVVTLIGSISIRMRRLPWTQRSTTLLAVLCLVALLCMGVV